MDLNDKVAVITGGSGGIGKAMAQGFLNQGARAVIIADLDEIKLTETAGRIGCESFICDVTKEDSVKSLVDYVLDRYGCVDLFCSNAGSAGEGARGLADAANDAWQAQWELHVMAHIYASRAVLPGMIEKGEGFFLITASAAGLLAAITAGPYTVTKAASVKFAELLAIVHGDQGIRVSVLCPQGVNTAMSPKNLGDGQTDGIVEPEYVAKVVIEAINDERFHVLPHPEVEEYVRRKGDNIDRWISGMRRLRRRAMER